MLLLPWFGENKDIWIIIIIISLAYSGMSQAGHTLAGLPLAPVATSAIFCMTSMNAANAADVAL